MFIRSKLVILMLLLTLDGQVHSAKIFGGHEAVPHSRRYMVLLERKMPDGRTKHCGGFLLSKDFVMTAAHCEAKSFKVYLGIHSASEMNEAQSIPVEQAFPHKGYNKDRAINDVMLLKLGFKATFNNNVEPIALAGQGDGSLPTSCVISGWGVTEKTTPHMSPKLMEVNVTLIPNKNCERENAYCSEGEAGPGKGDSGGPLVCDGKAYGVVSATLPITPPLHKYSKIPDSRKWIDSTIKHALMKT